MMPKIVITVLAIAVIGGLESLALIRGLDGEFLVFAITAVAGLAGYNITKGGS